MTCKTKIVDFFIFKRRNEEARKIFRESSAFEPPVKNMLLEVVDQIDNEMTSPDESQDDVIEVPSDDRLLDAKEEFIEPADEVDDFDMDDSQSFKEETLDHPEEQIIKDEEINEEPEFLDDEEESETILVAEENSSLVEFKTKTSPKKKQVRQANPENWMRNKRKLAKNKGESYVASNGKFIQAKQMKDNCGSCRMQCSKKISEEDRERNFQHFYELADIAKQRKFLFEHMKTYEPKRINKIPKNPQKVRAVQRTYYLDCASGMLQVCKLMFLNTFSISSQMIDTLHRKATNEGEFSDTRGKFERGSSSKQKSLILVENRESIQS